MFDTSILHSTSALIELNQFWERVGRRCRPTTTGWLLKSTWWLRWARLYQRRVMLIPWLLASSAKLKRAIQATYANATDANNITDITRLTQPTKRTQRPLLPLRLVCTFLALDSLFSSHSLRTFWRSLRTLRVRCVRWKVEATL